MTTQEKTLVETEARSKSNSKRIDSVEAEIKEIKEENKILHDLMTAVKVIAEKMSSIEEKVDDVKLRTNENSKSQREFEVSFTEQINKIKSAPATRLFNNWNQIKVAAVTAVATLLSTSVTYAVIHLLNK